MRRIWLGILVSGFAASAGVVRALTPVSTAPEFKDVDSNGVAHSLSEYHGKFVVLEWANRGCPYEKKHYLSDAGTSDCVRDRTLKWYSQAAWRRLRSESGHHQECPVSTRCWSLSWRRSAEPREERCVSLSLFR